MSTLKKKFYLLTPDLIPTDNVDRAPYVWLSGPLSKFVEMLENEKHIDKIKNECENILGFIKEQLFIEPVGEDEKESYENKANDKAFNIIRVQGDTWPMLIYSTLQGLSIFLSEAVRSGTNLVENDWLKLLKAPYWLLCFYLNKETKLQCFADIKIDGLKNISGNNAIRRWVKGHHYFMTIIQGQVYCTNSALMSLDNNNHERFVHYLNLLVVLMQGAEGALKFTGEFDENAYLNYVRPTLIPPNAPPGMSGLRWRDHEFLVRNLIKLKPYFKSGDKNVDGVLIKLKEALGKVYDAHKNVCKSFVHENTSLRSEKPAVEVIEGYKRARLHLFN